MQKGREHAKTEEGGRGLPLEGGFVLCEVEEQQAVQPQKRRAVIRVESEETHDYVMERRSRGYLSQEEVEEIGSVPCAVSEPLWALHLCDNECSEQGFNSQLL